MSTSEDGSAGRIISLCAGTVLPIGPAATIDVAAAAGYRHVGLRLDPESPPPGGWASLRRRADDLGLTVFDVEVVRLGMTTASDVAALIDAAVELGALWILTVSMHADRMRTGDELGAMVEGCWSAGGEVRPALEFMAFTGVHTLADAIPLAQATGSGVVIDALHVHRNGHSPADVASWMTVADAPPCYLQLCDTLTDHVDPDDLAEEARHRRLVPGTGFLPLRDLVAALPVGVAVAAEVQSDALLESLGPEQLARRCLSGIEATLRS